MSGKQDGDPAFPFTHESPDWGRGMSLRDWFAGMAIAGLGNILNPSSQAEQAYRLADAMLEERTK